ncbi:homocysteine S-methyltransferase [Amycolatopsis dongchuanensis]|uniref:Homocysteine S-methyltransferase n=1 Tax=Amycolatopsis dongchuanensis TaxID=1070866 RepID=A0ABP8VEI0_9PSEU
MIVLDGGLATELEARGHDLSDELWSARLLADDPGAIVAAHEAFFRAGAQIATTASYQASFPAFAARGYTRRQTAALLRRSVELAAEARDRVGGQGWSAAEARDRGGGQEWTAVEARGGVGGQRWSAELAAEARDRVGGQEWSAAEARGRGDGQGWSDVEARNRGGGQRWIAASVGPYGAMLADGAEYRGRYGLSVAELTAFHRPRVEALAEAGPDLLALETVPDVDEAVALLAAIEGVGVPAWLSYTIDGDRTRAGQPLEEAFAVAAGRDDVVAVGVNCCDPDDAARAIPLAREVSGKPVIAYPNSGEGWDATARRWTGRSRFLPDRVAGADLAGGCCRVGPEDIRRLALR